jgi:hypothetical protein
MAHTVEEALERFELVAGAGSETSNQACVMTLLAWVAGEAWTDHPPCSHPTLASLAVRANDDDTTTAEQRAELVRAGETGLLDTWWVPTTVVMHALASAPKDSTVFERAMSVAEYVSTWKVDKPRPNLYGAYLHSANLSSANLSSAYLRSADLRGADLSSANLSGANLSSANLSSANLSGADLSSANLSSANLSSAYLHSADLRGANLRGARGDAYTRLPAGWMVDPSGLIVPGA